MSSNLLNPYITFARNEGLRRGVSIWQSNNARDILETAMVVNTNLNRQQNNDRHAVKLCASGLATVINKTMTIFVSPILRRILVRDPGLYWSEWQVNCAKTEHNNSTNNINKNNRKRNDDFTS